MTHTHVAFASSERLHRLTDDFIQRMRGPRPGLEPDTLEQIMTLFIDEALHAFFTAPARATGLNPGMNRVVNLTTQTISKATGMVIRRSSRKMDLRQHHAAADYMDQVRRPGSDGQTWYVAFPIHEDVADLARGLNDHVDAGNTDLARQHMTQYLHTLTNEGVHWYFERPMQLLEFGPVMRKMAAVGVETTRKASRSLVNQLIPRLENEQLSASAAYQCSMLARFDGHHG
ncbi:hypothetical protein A11A3_16672 [Alcanivorax hongdengensis A-11-3]|uniref:Uncharacterized protein n=1 Tax=Alcanivorax hongdengensis A-11-3 TaxID=1177179 RepID=L0W7E2_9GAMM|nr:hypothetical protein [Alcanivorax hongdengensis]EKF72849.1 hypothetical protein A11A3_16672 [Alcanivorax hongdengensis A-11-3]